MVVIAVALSGVGVLIIAASVVHVIWSVFRGVFGREPKRGQECSVETLASSALVR